jgi:hypothetical protein
MHDLQLVGFTTDRRGLIFRPRAGARSDTSFIVPITDELVEVVVQLAEEHAEEHAEAEVVVDAPGVDPVEEPAPAEAAAKPRSQMSVRDIQARLRAGEPVVQVAAEAGVDEDWIERFAPPIRAEQRRIVERAFEHHLRRSRAAPSAVPLRRAVGMSLADKGIAYTVSAFEAAWSAHLLGHGRWAVEFTYRHRGRDRTVTWTYDADADTLTTSDRAAAQLGYVAPGAADDDAGEAIDGIVGDPDASTQVGTAPVEKAAAKRPAAKRSGGVKKSAAARKKSTQKKAGPKKKAAAKKRTGPKKKAAAKKRTGPKKKAAAKKKAGPKKKAAAKKKAVAKKKAGPKKKAAAKKKAVAKKRPVAKKKPTKRPAAKPAASKGTTVDRSAAKESRTKKAAANDPGVTKAPAKSPPSTATAPEAAARPEGPDERSPDIPAAPPRLPNEAPRPAASEPRATPPPAASPTRIVAGRPGDVPLADVPLARPASAPAPSSNGRPADDGARGGFADVDAASARRTRAAERSAHTVQFRSGSAAPVRPAREALADRPGPSAEPTPDRRPHPEPSASNGAARPATRRRRQLRAR